MESAEKYPKLQRQPLTLVLAEFRFVPARRSIESLYHLKQAMEAAFGSVQEFITRAVETLPDGQQRETAGWGFLSRDDARGGVLLVEPARVIYLTTQYPRFPDFSARCAEAITLVEDTLAPEQLFRVGLRYNDVVIPGRDEELADYLVPGLLPAATLADDQVQCTGHRVESRLDTEAGGLMVRAHVGLNGLAVMPDINEVFRPELAVDVPVDRMTAVLDFDHFWAVAPEAGEAFNGDNALDRLKTLHEPAREAFWRVTTDYARERKWS
ncbi:MAG: TIGR04255 family protein [Pseudohongiellaceae bacterium]